MLLYLPYKEYHTRHGKSFTISGDV